MPGAAAVAGLEDAGGILVGTVAHDETGAVVGEADLVQAGQSVDVDLLPLETAVAREQQYARAAGAVGQFFTACYPAGVRIEEVERT